MTTPTPTTWCTVADVQDLANTTVSEAVLAQAGAMIDMASARPYAIFVTGVPAGQVSKIGAADLYWLKLACAYQAAWLASQPDAFSRTNVKQIGRGTGSLMLDETALILGPLAKQAFKRVSFLKSRSLHVPGPMELDRPWLGIADDGEPGWQDLGPVY